MIGSDKLPKRHLTGRYERKAAVGICLVNDCYSDIAVISLIHKGSLRRMTRTMWGWRLETSGYPIMCF